jgi:hypothetical protein
MKIVVAEKQEAAADDDVIEARATPAPVDHATTDTMTALPPTVDNEGEAAEQALSAEATEHQTPPADGGQGAT